MKKLVLLISLLVSCVAIQAAPAIKIGVVNIQKIMESSSKVRAINASLQSKYKPRADRIKAAEQKFVDDVNKLKRNASVMTKSQIVNQQQALAKKRQMLENEQSQFIQTLREAQQKALTGVIANIDNAVSKVAKSGHYTLIIQRDRAVYFLPSMDVTPQVMAILK